ncbi:hypothetical protein DQ04_07981020 [Trypanosoma grayi]|uniref:hypothetical protein n=1 Tax=Trypanosoma grayi TaxID=71804 RepID=UPI0004F4A069|nr:hypothetical protein DQ04_07981020 [Trypanosoma grayi]KEG08114.1 hypothetical protein DQ04_07981020 [Trypanosoma grayi]
MYLESAHEDTLLHVNAAETEVGEAAAEHPCPPGSEPCPGRSDDESRDPDTLLFEVHGRPVVRHAAPLSAGGEGDSEASTAVGGQTPRFGYGPRQRHPAGPLASDTDDNNNNNTGNDVIAGGVSSVSVGVRQALFSSSSPAGAWESNDMARTPSVEASGQTAAPAFLESSVVDTLVALESSSPLPVAAEPLLQQQQPEQSPPAFPLKEGGSNHTGSITSVET